MTADEFMAKYSQKSVVDNFMQKYGSSADAVTRTAQNAGATPADLQWARANMDDQSYINWCLKFVDDSLGLPTAGRSGSAIDAWNAPYNQKVPGLNGIKPGDAVFFDATPSNGYNGHTAIYSGNNKMISGGWGEQDINQWSQQYDQPVLGYMPASQFNATRQ